MTFKSLALAFCAMTASGLYACASELGSESILRVHSRDTVSVDVRLPPGYDSTRIYPILIGLHGRGSRKEQFLKLWKGISKHDVIYVVPEAPFPFGNGFPHGFAWFRNQTFDSLRIAQDRTRSEEFIAAVAKAALARFGGSRTYLLGFSQGGNLAYHTGLRYRELFQGLITFGTYLDMHHLSAEKLEGAEGLRVYITHGRRDRAIAFQDGESAYRNLRNMGCQAVFREIPGGHVVDPESLDLALDWLFPKN